jgi:glucose/arabinose dehydrogenase
MFNFQKKISRTQNLERKKNNLYSYLTFILLFGLILSGCSLFGSSGPVVVSQPQNAPTDTTAPTPTPQADGGSPTEQPTELQDPTSPPTNTPITNVTTFPDPEQYPLVELTSGLDRPLFLTHAGDSSSRLFVVEKPGRIVILQDSQPLDVPFLEIPGRINSQDSERGLLGLAFHPNYAQNGYFYVNYTDSRGDTVVSRFQVTSDPNIADPNSEKILLNISQPYANHNGGMIVFSPDGYLYIGMGDGGSGGDPQNNAQNPDTLLGKILRIDVDSGDPYSIPEGNAPNALPEIWALGVRNPWRFSFDRATGDLWIGDVGQNQWEEVDFLPAGVQAGVNLGWDYYEGTHAFDGTPSEDLELVFPVIEYSHPGGHCSVTGGYVYRGANPDWQGIYLYGDYCSGTIWGALAGPDGVWQTIRLYQTGSGLASFGQDQDGELYAVYLNGSVFRLIAD